jgi:hypothetical protein
MAFQGEGVNSESENTVLTLLSQEIQYSMGLYLLIIRRGRVRKALSLSPFTSGRVRGAFGHL